MFRFRKRQQEVKPSQPVRMLTEDEILQWMADELKPRLSWDEMQANRTSFERMFAILARRIIELERK